jgi:hypothetical protein
MEIIRMNADDRNVAARKIYAKADGVAYIDKTLKVKATPAELEDAYIKGMLVVDTAGVMYRPISCKNASETVTVTYVTTDTTSATTAKLDTVKAEPAAKE